MTLSFFLLGAISIMCLLLAVPSRTMRRFPVLFLRKPLSPGLDYDDASTTTQKVAASFLNLLFLGFWGFQVGSLRSGVRTADFDQNFRYLGGSFVGLLFLLAVLTFVDNKQGSAERLDDRAADRSRPYLLGVTAGLMILVWLAATRDPVPLDGAEELRVVSAQTDRSNVASTSFKAPDRVDKIGSNKLRVNYLMKANGRCNHHGDIEVTETSSSITVTIEIVHYAASANAELLFADECSDVSADAAQAVNPPAVEHRYQEITLTDPIGDRDIILES